MVYRDLTICIANHCLSDLRLDEEQEEWPRILMLDRRLGLMMLGRGSEVELVNFSRLLLYILQYWLTIEEIMYCLSNNIKLLGFVSN